jgi:hypothetical protein
VRKLKLLLIVSVVLTAGMVSDSRAKAGILENTCKRVGVVKGRSVNRSVCARVGGSLQWVKLDRTPGALMLPTSAVFYSSLGISLTWSPPRDLGSTAITGYRLEFQTPSTPWLYALTFPASTYSTYIKDDRLAGATYRFRVAAFNSAGMGIFSESNWIDYPTSSLGGSSISTLPPSTIPVATPPAIATTTTIVQTGTVSQRNAASRAASYLRSSAFSRSGLIGQLEYEGFSTSDATYGVDAQNANWAAQAVKKGASYLRSSSFSRSGLISQLEYEGFSTADAVYGTDSQNADWSGQAAKKAASYLRSSSFSRSRLIDQLLYEGFTQSEAEYGVNSAGL